MKIDLTLREIELILMLVNEAAGDDDTMKAPVFSIEELALIEKLEMAIRKEELMEKMLLDVNQSTMQH